MNINKNTVFVITGPTASGKSAVGVLLAKKINGEIISADSMQIYKGLDIGTAKITEEEKQGAKHHLIDICDINKRFSVAEYKKMCDEKIEEIIANDKTPIIVGGTGLYINAVVNNMNFEEEKKTEVCYDNLEVKELIKILEKLDRNIINKIDLNNRKRIIRAIEIAQNGNLKSDKIKNNDLWHKNPSKYNFCVIYIDIPRDILYYKIEKRIDEMDQTKLLEEVKSVYNTDKKDITAIQAIGYKEFFDYINGVKTFEECKNILKQNTRHYAKRQMTWFKKLDKDIIVSGILTNEKRVEEILKKYNEEKK